MWEYQARLDTTRMGIVDGDTFDLAVDVGFYSTRRIRVRLAGVDTGEIFGPTSDKEYQTGLDQKRAVETWFYHAERTWDGDWPLVIQSEKESKGKYGRWIADVQRKCDDMWLANRLTGLYPEVER
jgi:endonuclease YncB( thermonuclease family)